VIKVAATALLVLIGSVLLFGQPARAAEEDFLLGIAALANSESYTDKEAAANTIAASGHPRAEPLLSALLEGQIYSQRNGARLVTTTTVEDGYAIRDAVTEEDLGTVGRRDVSRVTVNNQLRASLRALLATLKLHHPDIRQRVAAIKAVGESADPSMLAALETLRAKETERSALRAIETAVATLNLESTEHSIRLTAIEKAGANLTSHVRNRLAALASDATLDDTTRAAARSSIDRATSTRSSCRAIRAAASAVRSTCCATSRSRTPGKSTTTFLYRHAGRRPRRSGKVSVATGRPLRRIVCAPRVRPRGRVG
jgi:urea transport system permease protein